MATTVNTSTKPSIHVEDNGLCNNVRVPVAGLAEHCNPLRDSPWSHRVTPKMVAKAIQQQDWEKVRQPIRVDAPAKLHAARIAYLVIHATHDPIEIDVGVPELGFVPDWLVTDGNHRLAAAIYAKRLTIRANISGQINYAEHLFGIVLN